MSVDDFDGRGSGERGEDGFGVHEVGIAVLPAGRVRREVSVDDFMPIDSR